MKYQNTEKTPVTKAADSRHLARIKARNRRITLLTVSLCTALVLVACIAAGVFLLLRQPTDNGRIIQNVYVAQVNIGGMTPAEAKSALRLVLGNTFSQESMTVSLPGSTLTLAPSDTRAELDLDALVDYAYSLGRTGSRVEDNLTRLRAGASPHTIPLLPYLELDLDYIRSAVEDFCKNYSVEITQPTASILGERPTYIPPREDTPVLPEDPEDPEAPAEPDDNETVIYHQTLVLTTGTPQYFLESNDLYNTILDAYSLFDLDILYEAPDRIEPDRLDMEAVFDKFCIYPADAEMDGKTFEVIPEIIGYGFDINEVQSIVDGASYGERIEITMGFLLPDITAKDLSGNLFQDTLASFISHCTDALNHNRNVNLQLSCDAINGYVIKAGESFDFNLILGPRTAERGYKLAPNYSGSSTSSVGGGISQTASALHYCAVISGLQIDERHAHRYKVDYTPMGTDAAISYGEENLIFTNNTGSPIRILASVTGSTVTVTLQGTREQENILVVETDILETYRPGVIYHSIAKDNVLGYVDGQVLQTGHTGYKVVVYLCTYDPNTGELLSRDPLYSMTYDKRDQVIVKIEGSGDT